MRGFIVPDTESDGLDEAVRRRRADDDEARSERGPPDRRPQAQPQDRARARAVQEPDRVGPALRAGQDHRGEGQGDPGPGRADDHARQARRPDRAPGGRRRSSRTSRSSSTSCSTRSPRSTPIGRPGYTRIVKHRPAPRRRGADRPDRARLTIDHMRRCREGAREATGALPRHGSNTTARTSPASRSKPGSRTVQGELEAALARLGDGVGAAGRRGRTDRRRGARHGPGDRIHLRRAALGGGARAGARGAAPAGRRDPRPAAGAPAGSTPATRRGTGSTATPSGTGRAARFASVTALGVRDPLDIAAMARAGPAFDRPARLQRLRGGGPRSRSGPFTAVRVRRAGRS